MMELETSSRPGNENDKTNLRHKYALGKVLQTVLLFDNESDYLTSDIQNNCIQLKQLKKLEDT